MLRRIYRASKKYSRRSREEQRALRWAFCTVVAVRAGLSVIGFRRVLRVVHQLAQRSGSPSVTADPAEERRILWAVRAVARRLLPGRPCLSQALAAHLLLGRRGRASQLRIGVTKRADRLAAHAWLEQDGRIVIGGAHSPRRFTPLPPLG